jgi:hypothetical protein
MQYGAAPPYAQAWQQQKDDSDLRTLSILHYVYAGLLGVGALFSVVYIAMGVFVATAVTSSSSSASDKQAGAVMGGLFIVVGAMIFVFLAAKTVLLVLAGRALSQRRRYMLAFITACITCINVPLGTALGIFTILVLQRPSVKAAFGPP